MRQISVMLLHFVIDLWLWIYLVQSQANDEAYNVSVPIRHSLPDSRTESVFGSSENGSCSSVIPSEHRGSICNGTSVLTDGIIPALNNTNNDSTSLWAAQLLTLFQIKGKATDNIRIVLSFEVKNQFYDCMELTVLNCPERGMNASLINIYRDTSFRPERNNATLGTMIETNHVLSNTSCHHLIKFHVSFMSELNSSYFNIEFPRPASDNYVFVGEVSFLTGAIDCEQWPPELIEITNYLRNSKWVTDLTDEASSAYTPESSTEITDHSSIIVHSTSSTDHTQPNSPTDHSSIVPSTNSTGHTPQNSEATLIAVIAAPSVTLFAILLVIIFVISVLLRLKRKKYQVNNIQILEDYGMTDTNKESETRLSNSTFKTATINSKQQRNELMSANSIPVLEGIYSNPNEMDDVATDSFIEKNDSLQLIDEQQQKQSHSMSDVIDSSTRRSLAPVLSKQVDDHEGDTYAIPKKEKCQTGQSRASVSSMLSRAEFEASTEALLQHISDESDTKGLIYESIDSIPAVSDHKSSSNNLQDSTGTEQPIATSTDQPIHSEGGILDTDAIYAEPLRPPSVKEPEWDPDQNIYESLYSEPLKPSLFMQETSTKCQGKDMESEDLCPYSSIYTAPEAPLINKPLSVSVQNIKVIKHLGNGNFGKVVLAQTVNLIPQQLHLESQASYALVAVKKLKANASEGTKELFDKEVKFMSRLSHPNVVRLLGVCTDEESPFIMMEYMINGDLNQYLKEFKMIGGGTYENIKPITVSTLANFSVQIASAMQYLASHNFVHRDLATRNCLVGSENTIKISDFGMSRSLYESHYYIINGHAILPIRWMATECFYGKFSAKTDVWAFGVTMWEIFTLAKEQPYNHLLDQEVVEDAIKGPDRTLLEQPAKCPQDIYDVMKACWVPDAAQRPMFDEIYEMLSSKI